MLLDFYLIEPLKLKANGNVSIGNHHLRDARADKHFDNSYCLDDDDGDGTAKVS